MDLDLFDFENEFLLFQDNALTQKETCHNSKSIEDLLSTINLFCSGEDSLKSSLPEKGFVVNSDLETVFREDNHNHLSNPVQLFNFTIDENFLLDDENLVVLGNIARMNIQKLFALSSANSSEYITETPALELRQNITKFFILLRSFYNEFCPIVLSRTLNSLRLCCGTFDSIPNFSIIQSAHGSTEKRNLSAQFHLLHGNLEWRWLHLTTILKIEKSKGNGSLKESNFEHELKLFMFDLITLTMSKFDKCHFSNLIFSSPFSCACVKESWFLIQQLILRLGDDVSSFWCYFNNIVDQIKDQKNIYNSLPDRSIFLRTSINYSAKNQTVCNIWLMCGLVKVYGINSKGIFLGPGISHYEDNYELLETLIKTYLKEDQSEENMRILLFIISEVLTQWWLAKTEILMVLWEYFHKKICSTFFIAGQNLSTLGVTSNTAFGFLEQIKLQQSSSSKLNINQSSYIMFVHILGKIVEKFQETGQKVQIQKIFGRILTKFPASKLCQLNEIGIHHITTLFITLAVSADLKEVGQKISDTFLQMPLDKLVQQPRQVAITKGHMALFILFLENDINISSYATKFLNHLNLSMEKSEESGAILKIVAEGMQEVFLKNENSNFDLGEELFIDSWIIKYLNCSSSAEQDRLFETLSQILQKIRLALSNFMGEDSESLTNLVTKFYKVVLPFVKLNFSKNGSIWLPELAANLCLLAGTNLQGVQMPKFEELFKNFIEINCQNIENSIKFVVVIISSDLVDRIDKNHIIQLWIKYSVLLSGNNKDLKLLTKSLINLKEFQAVCQSCVENSENFLNAKEPLATFISDIGKRFHSLSDQQKQGFIEKFNIYFASFDRWALQYIQQCQTSQTSQSQTLNKGSKLPANQEIIMRIYTIIALIVMHCSNIIYIRSRSSCFFNILMSQFILPTSVLMGKSQPTVIVAAIAKIWHVLIEGISKLDFKNDPNLNKNLSDLIVKWTPQFKTESCSNSKAVARPFVSAMNLRNKDAISFIWEKLGRNFISLNNRQPNSSACMVLTIMEEVLHVVEADQEKLLLILRQTLYHLMEHAMMSEDVVPSKAIVYRLLERLMQNKNLGSNEELQQLFVVNLKSITTKHLSYYSTFYFNFIFKLVRFNPKIVAEILEFLHNQIMRVEQLRGTGRDMKLRTSYEKLQGAVKAITDKK